MRSLGVLFFLTSCVLLCACSRSITVSTVLEDTGGLRPGDKVLLAGREVGEVDAIEADPSVTGFVLSLGLFPEHAELVRANAVAYVPLDGPPRVELVNPAVPGEPVAAGGRLKGLSPFEFAMWRAGDAVDSASDLISGLGRQIEGYFDSEDWARTRAEIDREVADLSERSGRAAESISAELGRLVESLRESARNHDGSLDDEVADIQREIDQLDAEGHPELAAAVRRLLEKIESMAPPEDRKGDDAPSADPSG
jgi:hypothetical protein